MVTLKAIEHTAEIANEDHQHAFVLVGDEQFFGVHMTQYHCELHKYQIILKLTLKLPPRDLKELRRLRQLFPNDTFVLCNAGDVPNPDSDLKRKFCIPDLGSGEVTNFAANIFQGFRPLPEEVEARDSHYFPWKLEYAQPLFDEFEAEVERVVLYRPFEHLQTAMLVTDAFEPPVFGPDYDHVLSLAQRPDWLNQRSILEAGIVVTTPIVRLVDAESGEPTIPQTNPLIEGSVVDVLYRGIGPARTVSIGPTFSYCTAVSCSPRFFAEKPASNSYLDDLPEVAKTFEFSIMPKRYWTPLDVKINLPGD